MECGEDVGRFGFGQGSGGEDVPEPGILQGAQIRSGEHPRVGDHDQVGDPVPVPECGKHGQQGAGLGMPRVSDTARPNRNLSFAL